MLPEETPGSPGSFGVRMLLRVLAGIFSAVINTDSAHVRRRYLLAMVLSILTGMAVSVWLALDSPNEAPTPTSYLPAA
jgi:hypothetical protein